MRFSPLGPLLVSIGALAAVVMIPGPVRAAPQRSALMLQPYTFENSKDEKVAAEMGRLHVPENRKDPDSRTIELAFVRFKSTSATPGTPIIYLAGGPGGSGIDAAKGSRFPLFMAMRELGDVIALDQRGTGASTPELACSQRLDLAPDQAATREVLLEAYRQKSRACAADWRRRGVDLTGYNTEQSADDLNDLRRALGAEKVRLWGISYGSHLALSAIRRHGSGIERAILAGVEGPDHTHKLPGTYRNHLKDLARLVEADPEASRLVPDLEGLAESVVARLEREPVQVSIKDPATGKAVTVTMTGFLFKQLLANIWGTDGVTYIPYWLRAASQGDYADMAQLYLLRGSGIPSAMQSMMDCSSNVSRARLARANREAKDTLFGDLNFPFMEVCNAWDSPNLVSAFRSPVRSSVPVLFISGTIDAKTPVSNAEEVRRGLSRSEHLIINGALHSDPLFLSSPTIATVMLEFMRGDPISTRTATAAPIKFVFTSPFAPKPGK